MSRTPNTIITSLAAALVVAAAVAPGAGASARTATELGQSTGSPPAATPSGDSSQRTASEVGQAVGEPGDGNGAFARTATELGQSTDLSPSLASGGESGGFNWGDAAIVAGGGMALLIGVGGILLFTRRGAVRKPRTPVVSS